MSNINCVEEIVFIVYMCTEREREREREEEDQERKRGAKYSLIFIVFLLGCDDIRYMKDAFLFRKW